MKLEAALDTIVKNPRRKALVVRDKGVPISQIYYDPTFDADGLRVHHVVELDGGFSGFGFGAGAFSLMDVFSNDHEVIDVDFAPHAPGAPEASVFPLEASSPPVLACKCGALCDHSGDGACSGQVLESVGERDAKGKPVHRCMSHASKYGLRVGLTIAPEVARDWFGGGDSDG